MFGITLLYLAIGVIISGLVVFVHLISAEVQGYWAFDYWEEAFPMIESKLTASQILWSMIIWPVRLWQFVKIVDVFYDIYDWRKCGPRRRKGWL